MGLRSKVGRDHPKRTFDGPALTTGWRRGSTGDTMPTGSTSPWLLKWSRDTSWSRWGMMRSPRSYLVSACTEAFHTNALNHQKGLIWTFQRNTVKGHLPSINTTLCGSVRPQRPIFGLLSPLFGKHNWVYSFGGVGFLVTSFRNKCAEVNGIVLGKGLSRRSAKEQPLLAKCKCRAHQGTAQPQGHEPFIRARI